MFSQLKQFAAIVVVCMLVYIATDAHAALFNITDTTFSLSAWQLTGLQGSNVTGATASVTSGLSGNARRIVVTGNGNITYQLENYKIDGGFSPSLGLITNIQTEIWAYVSGSQSFQNTRMIARQGGGFYISPPNWDPPIFTGSPQKFTTSQGPAAYSLFHGSGPATLDLSPAAPTIFFGYLCYSPVFLPSPVTLRNTFFVVDVTYIPFGDINGDDHVDIDDLLAVVNAWGPCAAPPASCPADINVDGMVNIDDLLGVIGHWQP